MHLLLLIQLDTVNGTRADPTCVTRARPYHSDNGTGMICHDIFFILVDIFVNTHILTLRDKIRCVTFDRYLVFEFFFMGIRGIYLK